MTARRTLQIVLGLGLAVGLLIWGLPYFAKTTWGEVWTVLDSVPTGVAWGLLGVQLLGLWCYTFTMKGALPGVSHWRALIVNVAGSSVGNLLPGGGAAGLAATYTIFRSWGYSRRAISTFAIVTGVWNVLARVLLPVLGILALVAGNEELPAAAKDAAVLGALTGLGLLAAFVAVMVSQTWAARIGHALDRLLRPITRRRKPTTSVDSLVRDLRLQMIDLVRSGWLMMTLGLVGYFAVYYVLFVLCLRLVGVELFFGSMFAAYAVGRLLTAVGVTPGGLGVTETGTAAFLVSSGADPASAMAGVVLFSLFTHLLEVPLGALGWLAWTLTPKTPVGADDDEHEDAGQGDHAGREGNAGREGSAGREGNAGREGSAGRGDHAGSDTGEADGIGNADGADKPTAPGRS